MDFTLNELSLRSFNNETAAILVLSDLADVTGMLFSFGFRSIKLWNKGFVLSYEISPGFRIVDWLKKKQFDSNEERDRALKLKSALSVKSDIWSESERVLLDSCPIVGINTPTGQEFCEGLKIAFLKQTIAVSLNSDSFWDSHFLELLLVEEMNGDTIQQLIKISHAARISHLESQKTWIAYLRKSNKLLAEWDPSKNFFPNLYYSNMLVKDGNWSHFITERDAAVNREEYRAIIIRYALDVAYRNGYSIDRTNSARNSSTSKKRIIFSAGEQRSKIYLSIDLEKGGFEVCDYRGHHIGEYFFDGEKKSGPKPAHNIELSF